MSHGREAVPLLASCHGEGDRKQGPQQPRGQSVALLCLCGLQGWVWVLCFSPCLLWSVSCRDWECPWPALAGTCLPGQSPALLLCLRPCSPGPRSLSARIWGVEEMGWGGGGLLSKPVSLARPAFNLHKQSRDKSPGTNPTEVTAAPVG